MRERSSGVVAAMVGVCAVGKIGVVDEPAGVPKRRALEARGDAEEDDDGMKEDGTGIEEEDTVIPDSDDDVSGGGVIDERVDNNTAVDGNGPPFRTDSNPCSRL